MTINSCRPVGYLPDDLDNALLRDTFTAQERAALDQCGSAGDTVDRVARLVEAAFSAGYREGVTRGQRSMTVDRRPAMPDGLADAVDHLADCTPEGSAGLLLLQDRSFHGLVQAIDRVTRFRTEVQT